jgi:hypothetical protein
MGARKYSITTFSLSTENANTPYEIQQKGKERVFGEQKPIQHNY